jgi:peptidoglycan hydrolase-like protein with peptidoglycan-binding domain
MENTGKESLKHLFLVQIENTAKGRVFRTSAIDKIDPQGNTMIAIDSAKPGQREDLLRNLQSALEKEGLYPAEAKAMVKTWEDSWFDETGIRILYVLGKNWTDEILPLTIKPQPQQIARVMLGRAEVITPQMEIALRDSIMEYWKGDAAAREKAITKARNIGLDRFTDPVVRRVVKKNPGQDFSKAAFELAGKSSQPAQAGPVATVTREESQNLLTSISTR